MTDDSTETQINEVTQAEASEGAPVRRHPTASKTPFDYPFVFPALLFALGCWFGYDGWLNEDMADHLMFNRVLFGVFAIAFVWTLSVDYRIYKIQQRKKAEAASVEVSDVADAPAENS